MQGATDEDRPQTARADEATSDQPVAVVQGVVVTPSDVDIEQQVVVTATVPQRSRSGSRVLHRATSAANLSAWKAQHLVRDRELAAISLARQHSREAWTAEGMLSRCQAVCKVVFYVLVFLLQFSPHVAALLILMDVGGGSCSQPIAQWLPIVGGTGLAAHVFVVLGMLCSEESGACCFLIAAPCLIAWFVCLIQFVAKSFDCIAFDVALLNRLDVNRTLFDEPLPPDSTYATTRAHALVHCDPLGALNQTLPCAYVLLACEPDLWHATRGLAIFWIIVDGMIASAFFGGFGCLFLATG